VNIEQLLSATDAGNNEEIIKCLSLNSNNMKSLGAGVPTADKEGELRESRIVSSSSVPDDDHGSGFHKPTSLPIPEVQEVEEVIFECINCSG
jgi:hypothetical protein